MNYVRLSVFVGVCLVFTSCNEGGSSESEGVTKSDTVISGLEGSRDQSGHLSTDVKPDTTSGQSDRVRPLGQRADSLSTRKTGGRKNEQ